MALSTFFKYGRGKLSVIRNVMRETKLYTKNFTVSRYASVGVPDCQSKEVQVTFIKENGERLVGKGKEGDSLLDIVVNNDLNIDGYGICDGTITCSTCHVILKPEDYEKIENQPSEEEVDMLDLAIGLSDTSRLGCQIIITKKLDGLEVQLPESTNDARS